MIDWKDCMMIDRREYVWVAYSKDYPYLPVAMASTSEELADVQLCAEVLDRGTRIKNQLDGIAESKLGRWAKRLEDLQ